MAIAADKDFGAEAYSRKEIRERLEHWRELLMEAKAGTTQVSLDEIRCGLNRWLDEMCGEEEIRCMCGDEKDDVQGGHPWLT